MWFWLKKHSINLRRQVNGRSKSFNELYKQYRDEKLLFNNCTNPDTGQQQTDTDTKKSSFIINPLETVIEQKAILSQQVYQPSVLVSDINEHKTDLNFNSGNLESINTMIDTLSQATNAPNSFSIQPQLEQYQIIQQTTPPSLFTNAINETIPIFDQKPNNDSNTYILSSSNNNQFDFTFVPPTSNDIIDNSTKHIQSNQVSYQSIPLINQERQDEPYRNTDKLNLNYLNTMLIKHQPRPSAVTSYNARLTNQGGGFTVWNRRQDNLRYLLTSAFNSKSEHLFLPKNRTYTNPNTLIENTKTEPVINPVTTSKNNNSKKVNKLIYNKKNSISTSTNNDGIEDEDGKNLKSYDLNHIINKKADESSSTLSSLSPSLNSLQHVKKEKSPI